MRIEIASTTKQYQMDVNMNENILSKNESYNLKTKVIFIMLHKLEFNKLCKFLIMSILLLDGNDSCIHLFERKLIAF